MNTGTGRKRTTVEEPIDPQCGISRWFYSAIEMNWSSFLNIQGVLHKTNTQYRFHRQKKTGKFTFSSTVKRGGFGFSSSGMSSSRLYNDSSNFCILSVPVRKSDGNWGSRTIPCLPRTCN